ASNLPVKSSLSFLKVNLRICNAFNGCEEILFQRSMQVALLDENTRSVIGLQQL
ncbi:hypothetical protein SCLCIDRAFT_1177630, partial [Scleroderma citrinum Foug A]